MRSVRFVSTVFILMGILTWQVIYLIRSNVKLKNRLKSLLNYLVPHTLNLFEQMLISGITGNLMQIIKSPADLRLVLATPTEIQQRFLTSSNLPLEVPIASGLLQRDQLVQVLITFALIRIINPIHCLSISAQISRWRAT